MTGTEKTSDEPTAGDPLPIRVARFALRERSRYVAAWVAVLAAAAAMLYCCWVAQDDPKRGDGNGGHVSLDFSGQWLMGRLLVTGQGRDLYDRRRQRAVLEAAYPLADGSPEQRKSDAEGIMWSMMGEDDPAKRWVGGPLYPPLNAFLSAPLALLEPRPAYRTYQALNILFIFAAGWGVRQLSGGRVWWPVATLILFGFPGLPGAVALAQNPVISLAILVWGWVLTARGRPVWGGAVWGLLAYKPVWAAAFFLVPVLTRRWRMALAMLATGAGLAALTLPVVGLRSWLDWLHVGHEAAELYKVDSNWIPLSRDLLGIPRRWYTYEQLTEDPLAPTLIGWALWAAAAEITVRLAAFRWRRAMPADGPAAAFMLLGAWLTCYHFMYYDVLLAALPVWLLFTDPRPYLHPVLRWLRRLDQRWLETGLVPPVKEDGPEGVASPVLLGLAVTLLLVPPVVEYLGRQVPNAAPWETVVLATVWLWCGWLAVSRNDEQLDATQFVELGPDVRRTHEHLADQHGADAGRL